MTIISEQDFDTIWGASLPYDSIQSISPDLFIQRRVWRLWDELDDRGRAGHLFSHVMASPVEQPECGADGDCIVTEKPWDAPDLMAYWFFDTDEEAAVERFRMERSVEGDQ